MECINIFGIIGEDVTLQSVKSDYSKLKNKKKVIVKINSIGGSVDVGYDIRYFLKRLDCELETHVIGVCYSIATIIALSAPKDKRFMAETALFMVHLPFIEGLECKGNLCNADYLEWTAKYVKQAENKVIATYIKEVGNDKKYWKDFMKNEEYLQFQQTKDKGFVADLSNLEIYNLETNSNVKPIIFMKKKLTTLEKIFNFIGGLKNEGESKPDVKSMETSLLDGTEIYIETEDEDILQKTVYKMDGSVLENGEYTLLDNRIIVVTDGVITEIKETESKKEEKMDEKAMLLEITNKLTEMMAQVSKGTPNVSAQKTAQPQMTEKEQFFNDFKDFSLVSLGARHKDGKYYVKNASVTPSLNYTYNGIEDLQKLFYQPTLSAPDMLRLFDVQYGVKSKQQLFRIGAISKIVKRDDGTCAITETGTNTTITNRTLDTVNLRVRLEDCVGVWNNIIFQEWLKTANERMDLTGTQIEDIILNVVRDAIRRDWFRIFSFGDTASANADFNQIDGLWKRLFVGAGTDVQVGNNAITVLNNTAGTTALDYIRTVYSNASNLLAQMTNDEKAFYVTRNFYENLMTQYENRVAELSFKMLTDGTEVLTFRGVPVYVMYAWSDSLTDTTNPLNTTKNMLVLYTTNKNHVIGVDGNGDEQKVELFYDRYTTKNVTECRFKLGYNYVHAGLSCISSGLV